MVNKVILLGNLGGDPQIKFSQNGTMVAIMKLATTEYVKKNGSFGPITEWHTIYAYGKLAEFCSELRKGDKVFVEGKLRKVSFEAGNRVFRVSNIIARSVKLVSRKVSSNDISLSEGESDQEALDSVFSNSKGSPSGSGEEVATEAFPEDEPFSDPGLF